MKNFLVLIVLISASSMAQQSTIDAPTPRSPVLPAAVPLQLAPRVGITGEAALTLPEVIQAVLGNNRNIEVSRLASFKAALNLRAAKGYFDPVFGGNGYGSRTVSPVASSLGGGTNGAVSEKDSFADPQISGNSRWLGTTYKLDFSSERIDNNNTNYTLNPTYATAATLNLTQPLWRGLLFDTNRERLLVAHKNIGQTQEQFKQQVIDITTRAIHAYWNLDYARQNLQLQIEAVHLAEQQDASNRRQVQQGTQAPVDVIQTQTQMSTYQQNVFAAQQQLTQAENALKELMLPNRNDPLWDDGLATTTDVDESIPVPTLDEALHTALVNRPDLKAGQIGVQVSELDARLAKEQAKPQITLTAQLEAQGLAGRVLPQTNNIFGSIFTGLFTQVDELSALAGLPPLPTSSLTSFSEVPGFFVGGYGQSLQNLRDGRFPTVKIGLQVSLPIGNRTARADAGIAEASRKQSVAQQQQLEMTVESDVRNALQQLIDSDLNLKASSRAARLAEDQYESELRQFKSGTSSVFLVLQRQTELITARLHEIRARADCGDAEADFDHATGTTLDRQHIEIESAQKSR